MAGNNKISFSDTELLRFITAGSVDDGKSTLIGRLLYDSKSIFEDQLNSITNTSHKRGMKEVDLSLLTDGLQAEREQGITLMWPIVILPLLNENLLSQIPLGTSNIPVTW